MTGPTDPDGGPRPHPEEPQHYPCPGSSPVEGAEAPHTDVSSHIAEGGVPETHHPEATGGPDDGQAAGAAPGGMRFQDPATATERPASLAEQRERERVRKEAEEQAWEQARRDAADAKKRSRRKKALIGGGVGVGLVGLIAVAVMAADGDDTNYENAQCKDENGNVVEDRYCSGNGHTGSGGMFFFYSGGHNYQYSYGSNAPVGAKANGSDTPQSGKSYANGSGNSVGSDGKTGGAVSRGGFGSKSGGSDSGSSKGGSGGGKSSGG